MCKTRIYTAFSMLPCCDLSLPHEVRCENFFSGHPSHVHNLLSTEPFQNLDFQIWDAQPISMSPSVCTKQEY